MAKLHRGIDISSYQTILVSFEVLKSELTAKGFNTKGIDGKYGNNTEIALKSWQEQNSFPANGIISSTQWLKLFRIAYF